MTYAANHQTRNDAASLSGMRRPSIYLGMDDMDLDELHAWLDARHELSDRISSDHEGAYLRGVYLGLSQIGMGFSPLADFPEGWRDAVGNRWRWNDVEFRPVIDGLDYAASNADLDIQDAPDPDFAAFARGVWDAARAARNDAQ